MTKSVSLEIKGIAILLMLFLHLFNSPERVEECTTYINFWNHRPLVYAMSRAAGFCVTMFIFVSGYAHGVMYKSGKLSSKNGIARIKKLYLTYWSIFLPFVLIGCLLRPEHYPGSVAEFVGNIVGYNYTYNAEWWFLFPYILLVLVSPYLIPVITTQDSEGRSVVKARCVVLFLLLFLLTSSSTQLLPQSLLSIHPVKVAAATLNLSFPFVVAVAFCLNGYLESIHAWICRRHIRQGHLIILIILLCLLRMCFGAYILNTFLPLILIPIYLNLRRSQWFVLMLQFFGRHSTNMWLCHTFFAYYLWHDQLYSLKYPFLIFIVLIGVSVAVSLLVSPLQKTLLQKEHVSR